LNALFGQKTQGWRRHGGFAGVPTLAGKPGDQPAQGAPLGFCVWKFNHYLHVTTLSEFTFFRKQFHGGDWRWEGHEEK
jgi:hypothetical protein